MVLYTPVVIGWVAESFVDKVAQTSRSPSLVFENNLILVFILGAWYSRGFEIYAY
jgi:hypothetical protein